MTTILATGGAGYIGSHTCVELLNENYNVIVADNYCNSATKVLRRVEQITGKKIKSYNCDIRNKQDLRNIFKENKIDAVIHFAGLKSVGESCKIPLTYYDNNIYGTINLCEVMNEFGVKKIVFSSSATVYGENPIPYKEDMKTGEVTNPYGRTKHMIEEILKDLYVSDTKWGISILRYFNPIGAHESGLIGEDPNGIPNNLMPFISKVAIGKLEQLTIFGDDYNTKDGTCIRDYIHVVDLAKGHIKALERLLSSTGIDIYNLGTGKGYSVLEIIHAFEDATGQKVPYCIGARRAGDLPENYSDSQKAYNKLGWKTLYNLNKMCEDTWNWQSKNPNGYK